MARFAHWAVGELWDGFLPLSMVCHAAVTMSVQACVWTDCFRQVPGGRISGSHGRLIYNYFRKHQGVFSKPPYTFSTPPVMCKSSIFFSLDVCFDQHSQASLCVIIFGGGII